MAALNLYNCRYSQKALSYAAADLELSDCDGTE